MDNLTLPSNTPKEARKTTDQTFDRIYKFYFNQKTTIELTSKEQAIQERWDFAWKMLCGIFAPRQVAVAIVQKFNVKRSIAYDDVAKCMMLFGDPRNANKEAKRIIAEEWIIKGIKQAWDDKDLDAYERMIGRYNKINKLENDVENELPEFIKNFRPTQVILNFNKSDVDGEIEKLRGKVLDITHEEVDE